MIVSLLIGNFDTVINDNKQESFFCIFRPANL